MEHGAKHASRLKGIRRESASDVLTTQDDGRGHVLRNDTPSDDKSSRFAEVVDRLAGGYKTVSQLVYEVLKEAIVSGTFAPGEWLRQEWLAGAIGVSRIPVRTALIQLESEGLIEFHPHRGARVRTLTSAEINEIFRLRALLESHALGRSMTRMSPSRIAELTLLARQLDAQPEGSRFLDARVRFYRELYDELNNPLLAQVIEELRSHLGRYLLGIRLDHHHEHHRHAELVAYVAHGDFAGAEAWLHAHLEDVRKGIEELILERPVKEIS
ncbi:MAG: GntR family transcriptional regulator, partial [Ktedonobacterales bacterium]